MNEVICGGREVLACPGKQDKGFLAGGCGRPGNIIQLHRKVKKKAAHIRVIRIYAAFLQEIWTTFLF